MDCGYSKKILVTQNLINYKSTLEGFMQNKYINVRKGEIFFLIGYILLIVFRVLKSSTLGLDDSGITYIVVLALFFAQIIYQKINLNRVVRYLILFLILCFYILKTKEPVVPIFITAIIAVKDVDFDRIVKISFITVSSLVVMIVLLALMGIIPDIVTYRNLGANRVACHGMGFNHSSALQTYYTFLCMEYFYLKKNKIKLLELILFIAIGYIIFLNCAERLRFYMIFIIVFLIISKPLLNKLIFNWNKKISFMIYPIISIVSLASGYFYNSSNSFFYSLNILLSNRLYYQNYAFNHFDISLFGSRINMGLDSLMINGNTSYFYLDSAYTFILFSYGIIVALIIIYAYSKGIECAHVNKNWILWIWFLMLAIDSFVGNQLMSIWSIPIVLFPFCRENGKKKKIFSNKTVYF